MKLAHFAQIHLGSARLRRRNDRRLRPVRPSQANELDYRAALRQIVNHLRTASIDLLAELKPHWPAVHDTDPPGLARALARMAAKFGNIGAVAHRLTNVADRLSVVRRNLDAVDERLGASIKASIGIDIAPLLHDHGEIAMEMRRAAAANVELITSIPPQHLGLVREAVEKAFATGQRWESLVARIKEIGDITDNRARLIARDQTGKLTTAFSRVRQTGLGIESYRWRGARDIRERKSHWDMEGAVIRWDSPPEVDGERVHAGEAILCRCIPEPRLDLDEVSGGFGSEEMAAA